MTSKLAYAKRTALVVVLLLIMAACGGSSGDGTTTTGAPAGSSTTAGGGSATTSVATSSTVEDFDLEGYFESHPITMVINTSAGGGTDAIGRFLAASMSQFLPGDPPIAVTNIERSPAITTIYQAPDDRLLVGFISRADAMITLQSSEESDYDLREMPVLGAFTTQSRGWYLDARQVPEYQVITDAIGQEEPVLRLPGTVAGETELSDSMLLTSWICSRLDLPCEMLNVADDGSEQIALMFERGEANMGESTVPGIYGVYRDDLEAGNLVWLASFGAEIDEEQFPGFAIPPRITEVIESEVSDQAILDEWLLISRAAEMFGKFLLTGPNVPEPVVESLRQAFADLVADPPIADDLAQVANERQGTVPPEEATESLHEETQRFLDNEDKYAELQSEFWETYWAG